VGWIRDGKLLGVQKTYELGEAQYQLTVFVDRSGTEVRSFRQSEAEPIDPHYLAPFSEPYGKADHPAALAAFLKDFPVDDETALVDVPNSGESFPIPLARGALQMKAVQAKAGAHGCRGIALQATLAAATSVPIARDLCDELDGDQKELEQKVDAAWSPDSKLLAVAWTVARSPNPPLTEARARNHVELLPREKLVTVDLLDCGAGPAMSALRTSLAARFTISHQGKALKARDHSVVYYAPGVQPEAEQIAAMLSANAEVKPLDYASPFAIAVAVAK
jgi:hypothetical protein